MSEIPVNQIAVGDALAGLLRDFAGIELNKDYALMAERRIRKAMGIFAPATIIMEPTNVS